jgi:hypothetical protein
MTLQTSDGSIIPKNYVELQKMYGELIFNVLRKQNKVVRNFEDLHGYIWMKIIEAKLIERFEEYVRKQMPKVLTALEACELLGISWRQWSTAMWAYHKGDPIKYDRHGNVVERRRGRWMPTPINLAEFQARGLPGYSAKTTLFAFDDVIALSINERFRGGKIRSSFRHMGRDIKDGLIQGEKRSAGTVKLPDITVTKAQFRNYLIMAVGNHYANFCRTVKRKHQERPYTQPSYMSEDTPVWEATLPDKNSPDADSMVALAEVKQMLSNTLAECMDGVESCKPVAEHETEMFKMLEDGVSLFQALGKMSIPPKVKSAIMDTIRPLAPEFSP